MKTNATVLNHGNILEEKIKFLSDPLSYGGTAEVKIIETHMSWVFLTDHFVYKLKKPVIQTFLDFSTPELRHTYCLEEIRVNEALAGDTYLNVMALRYTHGHFNFGDEGEVVDWLVRMKRLPDGDMLQYAIRNENVNNLLVQKAAEKLTDFYLHSDHIKIDLHDFRHRVMNDVESDRAFLVDSSFGLKESVILRITTDLLHFILKSTTLFEQRILEGRIIDCHGDLRPEHIFLCEDPVIIDRLEFNKALRVMDVAEELSFLALECEMLSSAGTGKLFLNVYRWKAGDKIPDVLVSFYKARRAFLRAKLTINHLLEERYQKEEQKWRERCQSYLSAATKYCNALSDLKTEKL